MTSELRADVCGAYGAAVESWAGGPAAVYRRLAVALLARAPVELEGAQALDLGAGTGVASEVLSAHGAEPVAVDLAEGMLRHRRVERPPAAVGDAIALPLRADVFDVVIAAFCVNHLPEPEPALREVARVSRSGAAVLASTFPIDREHPGKSAVEEVLAGHGHQRPPWYEEFRTSIAPRTGRVPALQAAASRAGLVDVLVHDVDVEAGLDDPVRLVDYRLAMPHTLGFVAALAPERRRTLREEAIAAVGTGLPSVLPVLFLVARVP